MAFYYLGALGCLAITGVIASVLVEEYSELPILVIGVASVGMLFLLGCAWRLFNKGRRYAYVRKGPRSRLVLTDSDSGHSRQKPAHGGKS